MAPASREVEEALRDARRHARPDERKSPGCAPATVLPRRAADGPPGSRTAPACLGSGSVTRRGSPATLSSMIARSIFAANMSPTSHANRRYRLRCAAAGAFSPAGRLPARRTCRRVGACADPQIADLQPLHELELALQVGRIVNSASPRASSRSPNAVGSTPAAIRLKSWLPKPPPGPRCCGKARAGSCPAPAPRGRNCGAWPARPRSAVASGRARCGNVSDDAPRSIGQAVGGVVNLATARGNRSLSQPPGLPHGRFRRWETLHDRLHPGSIAAAAALALGGNRGRRLAPRPRKKQPNVLDHLGRRHRAVQRQRLQHAA